MTWKKCEDCGGTGIYVGFFDKSDCKSCGGAGKYEEIDLPGTVGSNSSEEWEELEDTQPMWNSFAEPGEAD